MSPPKVPHLIRTDGFDRRAWRQATSIRPRIRELIEAGTTLHPGVAPLGRDLFATFFKLAPEIDTSLEDSPGTELGRTILGLVRDTRDAEADAIALDVERAAMATEHALTIVLAILLEILRDDRAFGPRSLLEAHELAAASEEVRFIDEQLATIAQLWGDEPPESVAEHARSLARSRREHRRDQRKLAASQRRKTDRLPVSRENELREATKSFESELIAQETASREVESALGHPVRSATASDRWELGQRIAQSEKLRKLAALVGQLRPRVRRNRARALARRPSTVHSVERTGEIARALPAELAGLRSDLRRRVVLQKLLEGDLLGYDVRGRDDGDRGALVVCVDGSGSMRGGRELWAKAVALAFLDVAHRQGRAFRALVFSGTPAATRTYPLLDRRKGLRVRPKPIDGESLVRFAEYLPGGGTSFSHPLREAVSLLDDESGHRTLRGGDIVLITDGFAPVDEPLRRWLDEARARLGFSIYGVAIDLDRGGRSAVGEGLGAVCDEIHRISELTLDAAEDIFESVT